MASAGRGFNAARAHPAPLDGLEALIAAEPALEGTLDTIVELARREVPPLSMHAVGRAEATTISRADAATWVARMVVGSVQQPEGHPRLDCAPLLGSPYPAERAKLRSMLAYFERIAAEGLPSGTLRVERVVVPARSADDWRSDRSPLTSLDVFAEGAIEDAPQCRQVDFANRFLGGGVLSGGNVQEEIRFAVAPEHLAMMIVSPMMRDDEAIVMTGCESFATTRGYGGTLAYAGHYRDPCPRLADGTPDLELVAIDAVDYRRGNPNLQYLEPAVLRELGKARAGFARDDHATGVAAPGVAAPRNRAIATGNWGCGAFHGDPPHKAVLQWLAASAEGRAIRYYSFGDPRVGDLAGFARAARERSFTVGALFDRVVATAGCDGAALYRLLLA
ncbi:MAG: hypothetical protein H0V17_01985 [Deltaproteobacteria bacterium]|nr:hypothetical protein [Deltaproteobacteria bacterium]